MLTHAIHHPAIDHTLLLIRKTGALNYKLRSGKQSLRFKFGALVERFRALRSGDWGFGFRSTWRPRGLSKSVISRVIIRVTPFRVFITLYL